MIMMLSMADCSAERGLTIGCPVTGVKLFCLTGLISITQLIHWADRSIALTNETPFAPAPQTATLPAWESLAIRRVHLCLTLISSRVKSRINVGNSLISEGGSIIGSDPVASTQWYCSSKTDSIISA